MMSEDIKVKDAAMSQQWRRVMISDLASFLESVTEDKTVAVLSYLLKNMNRYNRVSLTQDDVMNALNMSKGTVNKAFKKFKEMGFIKKEKRDYYINSEVISIYGSAYYNKKFTEEHGFLTISEQKLEKEMQENAQKEEKIVSADEQIDLIEQQIQQLKEEQEKIKSLKKSA